MGRGASLLLLPAHCSPSEKGSTLKENNLLPMVVNYFLLEQTPFQTGENKLTVTSPKSI